MKFLSWICIGLLTSFHLQSLTHAAATASSGDGGSITIETLDPVTRKPIPDGLLRPGMQVLLEVRAFDAAGKSIPCTPTFIPEQGVSGTQIDTIAAQADGTGLMTMGSGFGSAEVKAQCAELPNVKAKMPVVNNTLQAPAAPPTPPVEELAAPAAGAPAAAGGGAAGGVLLGLGLAAAVVALTVGLASSSSPCTPPSRWCRSADTCCPNDSPIYCAAGSAQRGCYPDVFITGCTEKVFCTTEY